MPVRPSRADASLALQEPARATITRRTPLSGPTLGPIARDSPTSFASGALPVVALACLRPGWVIGG
jgi:hypothetical protein